MATGAAEMMRCVFDGSLSVYDVEIERRPYHRNCSCALHKLKGVCSNACSQQKNISFPKKQPWTDCSLSIAAPKFSSHFPISMTYQLEKEKTQTRPCHIDDRISQ